MALQRNLSQLIRSNRPNGAKHLHYITSRMQQRQHARVHYINMVHGRELSAPRFGSFGHTHSTRGQNSDETKIPDHPLHYLTAS